LKLQQQGQSFTLPEIGIHSVAYYTNNAYITSSAGGTRHRRINGIPFNFHECNI
jgi:hypothetical protein